MTEIGHYMAAVSRLRLALQGLFEAIGEPWDIDQDCRFCAGHYDWHEDSCLWQRSREALDSNTGKEPT